MVKQNTEQVPIRMPSDLKLSIKEQANVEQRSMSNMMIRLLTIGLIASKHMLSETDIEQAAKIKLLGKLYTPNEVDAIMKED